MAAADPADGQTLGCLIPRARYSKAETDQDASLTRSRAAAARTTGRVDLRRRRARRRGMFHGGVLLTWYPGSSGMHGRQRITVVLPPSPSTRRDATGPMRLAAVRAHEAVGQARTDNLLGHMRLEAGERLRADPLAVATADGDKPSIAKLTRDGRKHAGA